MELRFYQTEAIEAVYKFLRERADNPCVVLPTGAGKSPLLAAICRDAVILWDGRVLVLAHVKELLEQNADKVRALAPTVRVGVYSAGLGRRDATTPVVVAGIQSVYDRAAELGRFDLVIIDEAHLIPPSGEGMYRKLLSDLYELNPDLRVIGLTATPYRLGSGPLCTPDGILNAVCYEAGVKELITKGYLSPLVNKDADESVDVSRVRMTQGEFREDDAEAAFVAAGVVDLAVAEVLAKTANRHSVILFCQSKRHAREVADALWAGLGVPPDTLDRGLPSAVDLFNGRVVGGVDPAVRLRDRIAAGLPAVGEIYGDTPAEERAWLIAEFRAKRLKYLVNVNVLTTGFDAPNVDCVGLLRATASPGLYYQIVGRGFRLSPGKTNCLILDFGGNIARHGPVDKVRMRQQPAASRDKPAGKKCPKCSEVVPAAASVCSDCGYKWEAERREAAHDGESSSDEPVSGKPKVETREVMAVTYSVHTKKGANETTPKTLRVTYQTGYHDYLSEWVCVEHEGFAANKARKWWQQRCGFPMPTKAVEALAAADHGLLAVPSAVEVKTVPGERFPEIVRAVLGDIPTGPDPCTSCGAVNLRVIIESDTERFPGRVVCGQCGQVHRYATPEMVTRWGLLSDPGRTEFGGMLDFYTIDSEFAPGGDAGDASFEDQQWATGGYVEPAESEIPF